MAERPTVQTAPLPNSTPTTGMPSLRGHRILVLDETPELCAFYGHVLTAQGYVAIATTDGEEAARFVADARFRFALSIVDVDTPAGVGWAFIKALRARDEDRELPVLAIADFADSAAINDELKTLADSVIMKGEFEIQHFTEIIQWLIRRGFNTARAKASMDERTSVG